ncbi:MAG: M1 family metallopeptidase, partial [Candidatus Binatia bacterium]
VQTSGKRRFEVPLLTMGNAADLRRGGRGQQLASSMLRAATIVVALAAGGVAAAQSVQPRVVNYRIKAAYEATTQTVIGNQTLTWRNRTRKRARDLCFHLYLNAFANNRSTFIRELGASWTNWLELHPHPWGYISVTTIRIGGRDVTARMQFVHPDDDNMDDRTVFRLPLRSPVAPGKSVTVEMHFVAKLPKIVARAGYAGPFAFVAQWFPKIGVYEHGAWNCHQYHATTEFYADFGVYDVTLSVPRTGVVGATGVRRDSHSNDDGTKTLHFLAEDVHDFAWAIDPRFRVVEDAVNGTTIRLLVQPNHFDQAKRHLAAAKATLAYYEKWVAPYPYPQLTIVDPGPGGGRAGGMEYPTLITVGTAWWMPRWLRFPEFVTVHETGHQFWYGLVASNEAEEAWLDEGINSYVEGQIMDAVYGSASYVDLFGLRVDSTVIHRMLYLRSAQHDPMVRRAWRFLDRPSYSAVSYGKTALVLDTLDARLGKNRLRTALAAYFRHWRFRHPHGKDFLKAIQQSTGDNLTWYFDQVIAGTGTLDYAVTSVEAEETTGLAGYPFVDGQVEAEKTPVPAAPQARRYHNEVVVERLGSVRMPVDVQIVFDDGTVTNEHWDGRDRWKRFEYTGTQRVRWAVADPNRTMPLDVNRLNNSRMRTAGTRGIVRIAGRWGFWFQSLVHFLSGL